MLWVGTYSAKGGRGLYPIELSGDMLRVGEPESAIANASFGLWCDRTRTAYFVAEQEVGRVAAWRREGGRWREGGTCRSGGSLPCHLALHPAGEFLAVANYGDGSVALIGLDRETGAVAGLLDTAQHSGRSVDPERQASPHVHCAIFDKDGRSLFVVDLGLDRIFRYHPRYGKLGPAEVAFEAPAGSGPRHLLFHPDRKHALLLCELSAELMLLECRSSGSLVCLQRIGTAPEHDVSGNLGGHLALFADGTVTVTNRGHDSLAFFSLAAGRLRMSGWRRTGGASARHFHFGQGAIVTAHENSGDVAAVPLPGADRDIQDEVRTAALPGAAFVIEIPD